MAWHDILRSLMGALQNHHRRHAVLPSLEPSRGAQAPAITGFESRKIELGHGRTQVVTHFFTVSQELIAHDCADGVRAVIIFAGVAKAISIKACTR